MKEKWIINPDWVLSLENEMSALKVELDFGNKWINKMCSVLGYDNSDGFHYSPDPFQIVKGMKDDMESLNRRLAHLETLNDLMFWLQVSKYRVLQHRHDGSFKAIDEALNVSWESDRLDNLIQLINDNPATEKAP